MHANARRVFRRPCSLALRRHASVSSNHPFPFPPGANPAPHEIFHLPSGASQDEIKKRYYELVKLYHPDVIHSQRDVAPSVRNARFRAIADAYSILCRRHSLGPNVGGAWVDSEFRDEAMRAELRRRSRRSGSQPSATTAGDGAGHGNADDSPLWYIIGIVLAGMMAAMGSASLHKDRVERHTRSAAANLAQARAGAQIHGMERRRQIRERVRAFREAKEVSNDERV